MAQISRRALLGSTVIAIAAATGAALGTSKSVHHKIAVPPPQPPSALTDALAAQRRLLAGYDAAIAASPSALLSALRADIASHAEALGALLENYPGWRLAHDVAGTPVPSTLASATSAPATPGGGQAVAGTVVALASASSALESRLATECVQWPATDRNAAAAVPLLGSMSACLSAHLTVLR
jgi:hypothetical protein